MPKRTSDPKYLAARKALLKDGPLCHWCQRAQATEADHLIEHDRGGDNSLENMVPACKPCNSRRGQLYKAQRDAQRQANRTVATGPLAAPFFSAEAMPPIPSFSVSCGDQPEPAGTNQGDRGSLEVGRELPRLETVGIGGKTLGPLVAAWAKENMHLELMPWQKHALDGLLSVDDHGALVFREGLVSTARQNGKSVLLQALVGFWTLEAAKMFGRPMNVLSVANRLDRAEAIHTAIAPVLAQLCGAKVTNAVGRKAVELPNGSTWVVRAASPNLHGGSYDLIVVDELFDISAACIDDALRPSMIARPNPLLACFSTAGDEGSTVMIQMRELAIAEIDAGVRGDTYFAEWSMPPDANPMDSSFWAWANPALGTTVTMKALQAASKKDSFQRAHLNKWVSARGAWLDAGQWADIETGQEMPTGGVLAVDTSVDEARYVGVRSAIADGKAHVMVEFVASSEDEMWDEISRVMTDLTCTLALTPTLEIHCPPELARRMVIVGYAELMKFSSLVRSMIVEGKATHRGQRTLTEHVSRAVMARTPHGQVLSSQRSPGPIELARCMVWAVALSSRPTIRTKPILAVAP